MFSHYGFSCNSVSVKRKCDLFKILCFRKMSTQKGNWTRMLTKYIFPCCTTPVCCVSAGGLLLFVHSASTKEPCNQTNFADAGLYIFWQRLNPGSSSQGQILLQRGYWHLHTVYSRVVNNLLNLKTTLFSLYFWALCYHDLSLTYSTLCIVPFFSFQMHLPLRPT